jgi:nicotinamide riboside transporter PnuC
MVSIPLDKIPGDKIRTYLFLLLALTIPGVGYLYLDKTQIFFSTDILRLIILSIFYSVPILIIGITFQVTDSEYEKEKNKLMEEKKDISERLMFLSSSFVLISFFGAILIVKSDPTADLGTMMYIVPIVLLGIQMLLRLVKKINEWLRNYISDR